MRHALHLLLFTCLLSLPLFGQNTIPGFEYSYDWNPGTVSMVDHSPWCATHSCLTSISTTMGEISASGDGTVYGLKGQSLCCAQTLYSYTAAKGWLPAPSGLQNPGGGSYSFMHTSTGSASQVLALTSNPYTNGATNVYTLNSAGTGWDAQTGNWLTNAKIAADGTIVGTGNDGDVYIRIGCVAIGECGPWKLLSYGSPANFAVGDGQHIWGVTNAGVLERWSGTAWVAVSPAPPFTPSNQLNGITGWGPQIYAVDVNNGSIHLSGDGKSWETIQGFANTITGGSYLAFVQYTELVSGVRTTTTYHINQLVPQISLSANGSASCAYPADCAGMVHTLTANVTWGGTTTPKATSGAYTDLLTVAATGVGDTCDALIDPSSELCQGTIEGSATCSDVGQLQSFSSSISAIRAGVSQTNYAYANQIEGVCAYYKSCPVGQTATCGVSTVYKATPCAPQFLEFYYIYYNFGSGNRCLPVGLVIGSSLPGDCD